MFEQCADDCPYCFNEAGAINPGKPGPSFFAALPFNLASMRPGRLTPENRFGLADFTAKDLSASMRPGRLTPENPR